MTELLAPAGNLEKLLFAAAYGADAVYFGLDQFSLRNFAKNFTFEDAKRGLDHLHSMGKRGYCTLNIYPFEDEYNALLEQAKVMDSIGVDAFIVADLGVISMLKKEGIKAPVHISTQANTLSPQTVDVYRQLGASRVNLARELSYSQIDSLQKAVKSTGMETEVFIHGSVCFSYSGRCAISDYLTGRRANRGECTQPCRWKYFLVEEKRPGVYMPVLEDERGLYLFNPKDLALFSYVSKLKEVGVTSLKIEGRMKSIHYLANVLTFYRRVLDGEDIPEQEGLAFLSRVKNRGYSHGFMKGGGVGPEDYAVEKESIGAVAVFLGDVTNERLPGKSVMNIRNKTHGGDEVEVLSPDGTLTKMTLPVVLTDIRGEQIDNASHGKRIILDTEFPEYSIVTKMG